MKLRDTVRAGELMEVIPESRGPSLHAEGDTPFEAIFELYRITPMRLMKEQHPRKYDFTDKDT